MFPAVGLKLTDHNYFRISPLSENLLLPLQAAPTTPSLLNLLFTGEEKGDF